ncbi:membrane protein insertase YidC [Pediococcus pentosaceus]|uniref:Membrane protein insertase YidC n=1 Tax=Pediococcus pentosaceus TaxID=1255 RepID=A0AB73HG71_PEDPE|nr:membrane protein insertase YidC [Pediococcus pentosaceus]MBF7114222.1 membrane protein insertase YidC [Pediococcus pentosaceus]MCM6792107.1 membrane protein insertase YidC [Pediococcus pentosaceus]MCM6809404.1 membrane protein insertase YidC [Pediococcus pentosaceus]MCM6812225.1 membrane protein insertase YidC [Pediococcus pentosaceus]MCM6818734.1 membrane protein insertase YidC [Pediococcus pentosaceus]
MKHLKRNMALLSVAALSFILTACSTAPITSHSTGIWDGVIVYNFSRFIIYLSKLFGGNYGWGIIVFTIIIRIIILPLMIYQTRTTMKTAELQPKLKQLQQKYSSRDAESQQKLREEQQKLYAEAGVNPMAGCLPLIIQLPVMYALYAAVSRTQVLKEGTFLWLQLSDKDPYFILPILAALFTFMSTWLSMKSQPAGSKNGMTSAMTFGMPLVILITALNFPAAITLYWVVTNLFQVGQTLIIQNPFKIQKEREEKIQTEKVKRKAIEKAKRRAMKSKRK